MENPSCKAALRLTMRSKRDRLLPERKSLARQSAFDSLKVRIQPGSLVLSYTSIHSELCLHPLNRWLAANKSLVLPTVQGEQLKLYAVHNMDIELQSSSWGIAEPNPEICEEVCPTQIDLALIPALAFDQGGHRLGYGRGFYDRLLASCQLELNTIGVGFKEQYLATALPIEAHDKPVSSLALF